MNAVILHTEYLLQHHDCVVLPGWGALIAGYQSARFDTADPHLLLPPVRKVAFNAELDHNDGLLAASIARRDRISYEAACDLVAAEIDCLRHQIDDQGEIPFGHIGTFHKSKGEPMTFTPLSGKADNAFFGLRPLHLVEAKAISNAATPTNTETAAEQQTTNTADTTATISRHQSLRRNIIGIAASLAVILTISTFLLAPFRITEKIQTASIAPIDNYRKAEMGTIEESDYPDFLTIAPAAEPPIKVSVRQKEERIIEQKEKSAKLSTQSKRFNSDDKFYVIVASFPNAQQAQEYIVQSGKTSLGILEKDGKFRIYAATGKNYAEANAQKNNVGVADAWICRK